MGSDIMTYYDMAIFVIFNSNHNTKTRIWSKSKNYIYFTYHIHIQPNSAKLVSDLYMIWLNNVYNIINYHLFGSDHPEPIFDPNIFFYATYPKRQYPNSIQNRFGLNMNQNFEYFTHIPIPSN